MAEIHSWWRKPLSLFGVAAVVAAGFVGVSNAVAPTAAEAAQDPTSCAAGVSITNGGFERPTVSGNYQLLPEANVPGWLTTDPTERIELWKSGFQGVPSAEGNQFAELNANNPSRLYQDVATVPGQTMRWTLKHRGRNGVDVMRVLIGVPGGTLTQSGPNLADGTGSWGSHSGTYVVPPGQTTTRFGFEAVSAAGGASSGNFLDDITFANGPCLITTKNVTNLTNPSGAAQVGDQLRYTVTVKNGGGGEAQQVGAADELHAGLTLVPGSITITGGGGVGPKTDATGDDAAEYSAANRTVTVRLGNSASASVGGNIPGSSTTTFTYDVKVNESGANTTIPNDVVVNYLDPVVNQPKTSTSQEAVVTTGPAADLEVTKELLTAPLVAGESAQFTMTVRNNGPQVATGVRLRDPMPDGYAITSVVPSASTCTTVMMCDLGTLAVGAEATVTITGLISPSFSPGSALSNTARVLGNETDHVPGNNSSTAAAIVATSADLAIQKTVLTPNPVAGGEVEYQIVVTNYGPSDAQDVVITDPIDPDVVVLGTSGDATCNVTATDPGMFVVDCPLGALAAGASATVNILVRLAADAGPVIQNTAAVNSSTSDPVPGDNTSTTQLNPAIETDLSVVKSVSPAEVSAGQTLTYNLAVRNAGPSDASNVVLSDVIPEGLTLLSVTGAPECTAAGNTVECNWPTFAMGAVVDLTVTARVDPDAAAGTLTNTATVVAPSDVNPSNNASSADVEVVQSADVVVEKRLITSSQVPGAATTYEIVVRNDGPSTARGVMMSDLLPDGFTRDDLISNGNCKSTPYNIDCGPVDLAPGASFFANFTGHWDTSATGAVSNTATATSVTPDPNLNNNTSTVSGTLAPSADIAVTKVATAPTAPLGGVVTYTVTVTNNGPSAAAGVVVTDTPSDGLTIELATPSVGTWDMANSQWLVGTLASGASASIVVMARAGLVGDWANVVNASAVTPDPDTTDNSATETVTIVPAADLSLVKTGPSTLTSNGPVNYTLTVRNNGPSDAENVVVTDNLPAGLITPTTSTPNCAFVGSALTCTASTLADGATIVISVQATVDPSFGGPRIVNTAQVSSATTDPNTANNLGAVISSVTGTRAVELVKTAGAIADANGNSVIDAGDTLPYTFTVRNTGNVTLTSAAITDVMLGGAVPCTAFPAGGLAPGASVDCAPANYTLTQADIDAGAIENTASVRAQSPRGLARDSAVANTVIPAVTSVSLDKSGVWVDTNGDGLVGVNDRIDYSFVVENTGTTTLTGATITDPLLGGPVVCAGLAEAVLAPGDTFACGPVAYVLTQADVDAGFTANTATATANGPREPATDTATAHTDSEGTDQLTLIKRVLGVVDENDDNMIGAEDSVSYGFDIRNSGTTTITDLTLSDPKLGGDLVCADLAGLALAPGESVTCEAYSYTITQPDVEGHLVENAATASGTGANGPITDGAAATTELIGTAAISLTKTVGGYIDVNADGMVGAGDTIAYSFVVRNIGTTLLTDIALSDPLLGGALTCPDFVDAELAPGAVLECGPVQYTLTQEDVDAELVSNTASVSSDSREGRATYTATVDYEVVGTDAMTLLKSAAAIVDANESGRVDAGDTIAYTFTLHNVGTTTLTDIAVTDPRLTGEIVCETMTLAPNEMTLCAGEPAILTQAEIDAGEIVNTATAIGTGTGNTPTEATDTIETPVVSQAAVDLVKTGGDYSDANSNNKLDAGDTVQFSFTVTNTGARTLTDIVIDDPKLGGAVACDLPELAPGAEATCGPISYTLTAADVSAAKVVNVATVSATAAGGVVTASASVTVELHELPNTGSEAAGLGLAVLLLLAGGAVLILVSIRRRSVQA